MGEDARVGGDALRKISVHNFPLLYVHFDDCLLSAVPFCGGITKKKKKHEKNPNWFTLAIPTVVSEKMPGSNFTQNI